MVKLVDIDNTDTLSNRGAPGPALIATCNGAGLTHTAPIYQHHGIASRVTQGDVGVYIPVLGSRRFGVVIATHNYDLNIELNEGETLIYATNSSGKQITAQIRLQANGQIELNGNTKSLVTWEELNTALQMLVASINTSLAAKLDGGGAPGALTLDISTAKTSTLKTGG